jgi:hypothetical protein
LGLRAKFQQRKIYRSCRLLLPGKIGEQIFLPLFCQDCGEFGPGILDQHHAAEHDRVLAQLERTPLHRLDLGAALVEQRVFELLDALVELLYGCEVAVDEVVEQAVQQKGHAMFGEVG